MYNKFRLSWHYNWLQPVNIIRYSNINWWTTVSTSNAKACDANNSGNLISLPINRVVCVHVLQRRTAIAIASILGFNVVPVALRADLWLRWNRHWIAVRPLTLDDRNVFQLDLGEFIRLQSETVLAITSRLEIFRWQLSRDYTSGNDLLCWSAKCFTLSQHDEQL